MILITSLLAVSVDWLVQYVPFEMEQTLAQSLVAEIDDKPGEVDAYLQSLADRITPYMDLPEDMHISVHYVNRDIVNAMATLGGHVLVYRGLLEKLPDENSLVMLLGHEIGHIKQRHPIKALGKGVVIGLALTATLGQSADSVSGLIGNASSLTMLGFSRDQEQASDEEGIRALNAYYHNVHSATRLFEIFKNEQQKDGFDVPEFLSSHPDTRARIDFLNRLAASEHWKRQGVSRPIPEAIVRKLEQDRTQAEQEKEAEK
ncbi:MAG TPA: M48 family metallopeptidase [Gammaproteobacteria bacterium]|nr:M48 family metallopeptidase [Gammaproteobacteria bacterium]